MKKTILVLTLLITFLSSFAAPVAPPSIKGIVIDKSNGEPLIGATVTLKNKNGGPAISTAVGLDGTFVFRNVQLGTYEIEVKYVSYKKTDVNFELTSADSQQFA